MKKLLAASLIAVPMLIGFAGSAVGASKKEEEAAAKAAAQVNAKAITVYVNGKGETSFAEKMNESHVAMAAQGWRFAESQLYLENGDMEGAFVTYVRN
jgi:hypothetical protein